MPEWLRTLIVSVVAFTVALCLMIWFLAPEEPVTISAKPGYPVTRVENPVPEVVEVSVKKREPNATQSIKLPRFEKLDSAGRVLPEAAESWDCVRDNENGLIWEGKQTNGGLRDLEFTYSWYSSDSEMGVPDGGKCYYIFCDTQSLVEAVNEDGLCGWRDWRLPTNLELMMLDTDRLYYKPDIDQAYFPYTRPGYYWSSTVANVGGSLAWSVNFLNGFPYVTEMRLAYYVRLVRDD